MRYPIALLFVCLFQSGLVAQETNLEKKLAEYDFEHAFLTTTLKDADAQHFFNLRTTIMSLKDTTIEEIEFDPRRSIGSKWKLISVNGAEPTDDDLYHFDHSHNTKGKEVNATVDHTTLKVHAEDEDYLVVEFYYNKESLPVRVRFFKDCVGYAHINKFTKKLEKAEYHNLSQLRMRDLRVNDLKMDVNYEYQRGEGIYHIKNENLEMLTYYHGVIMDITTLNEYSNFKKVLD